MSGPRDSQEVTDVVEVGVYGPPMLAGHLVDQVLGEPLVHAGEVNELSVFASQSEHLSGHRDVERHVAVVVNGYAFVGDGEELTDGLDGCNADLPRPLQKRLREGVTELDLDHVVGLLGASGELALLRLPVEDVLVVRGVDVHGVVLVDKLLNGVEVLGVGEHVPLDLLGLQADAVGELGPESRA